MMRDHQGHVVASMSVVFNGLDSTTEVEALALKDVNVIVEMDG